jgi:hypothetical protein
MVKLKIESINFIDISVNDINYHINHNTVANFEQEDINDIMFEILSNNINGYIFRIENVGIVILNETCEIKNNILQLKCRDSLKYKLTKESLDKLTTDINEVFYNVPDFDGVNIKYTDYVGFIREDLRKLKEQK